jgi:type VI secretion system secreted protein VgrG
LTTSSGFGITLAGGAKPSQVFWEVGSSATIGVGSQFFGTILANTSITLVSGATLNGRALAGAVSGTGAVTMDDNTVVLATP